MNDEWQRFLEQQGAHFGADAISNFGDLMAELGAAAEKTVLCDLSHTGLIRVQGEDSQTFLQGQLTNDIRAVGENTHQLSGYCNPKGRLLALFQLFMSGGNYYLQFPRPLLDGILKRLRMFVLRSRVTLDDVSDDLIRFTLSGPDAETLLSERLGEMPGGDFAAITVSGITVLRLGGPTTRFLLCGELATMRPLWQALRDSGITPVGDPARQWLEIQAGQPIVVTETAEAFVPQMLNLHLINGVSFKKGCYTGQEVVARMQYLGKLKRRMYLTHVSGEAIPQAGAELFSPQSESGQGAGRIVAVAASPDGGYDMLAVLEIATAENGKFYLDETQQHALIIKPLPYEFEQAT